MMKKLGYLIILSLALVNPSQALSLTEIKAQGLVGEGNNGYLIYVTGSPTNALKAFVTDINNKRKAKFTSIAKKSGATTQQVVHRFYEKAKKATKSGNFYQNASGNWVKK